MTIRKMKYGFFSIIDKDGREIAVASSWNEANRIIRKFLTNRTNIINNK